MGRKTNKKSICKLLNMAKDRLCTLGELDLARELGMLIDKISPKGIDLDKAKEIEITPPEQPKEVKE